MRPAAGHPALVAAGSPVSIVACGPYGVLGRWRKPVRTQATCKARSTQALAEADSPRGGEVRRAAGRVGPLEQAGG